MNADWIQRSPLRGLLQRIDNAKDSVVVTQAELDSLIATHPALVDLATEPVFLERRIAGFMWTKTIYVGE